MNVMLKFFKYQLLIVCLMLACATGLPSLGSPSPGPTHVAKAVEVTVVYLSEQQPIPVMTSVASTVFSDTVATNPTPMPSDTPLLPFGPTATFTPQPTTNKQPPPDSNSLSSPVPSHTPVPSPSPDPTPTIPPTPTQAMAPLPEPFRIVELLPSQSVPANGDSLEFVWHWEGKYSCVQPENHGFDIRIWSVDPTAEPQTVMDAVEGQKYIQCNSETNIYSMRLANGLQQAPGVQETHIGKFYWDVAYVELSPYKVIQTTEPGLFEITLDYTGPLDPNGADLSCNDFDASWAVAQAIYIKAGGPAEDPHDLDPDQNGIACDELR